MTSLFDVGGKSLFDVGSDDYESQLDRRIQNYNTRFQAIGQTPPEPKKPGNFLTKALDIIDRPRNAIVNAIQDSKTGENSWRQGFMEGLKGQEKAYVSDLLPQNMNKTARGVLGFAGDVLLDPTTYVGVGAAKSIGAQGGKRFLKFMGQNVADVTPITSRIGQAVEKTGIPKLLSPLNPGYIDKTNITSPEQLQNIQAIANRTRYLPQTIRGQQQIARDSMKEAWKGVRGEVAEQVPGLMEAPIETYNQNLLPLPKKKVGASAPLTLKDVPENLNTMIRSSYKLGNKPDTQTIEAARIAHRLTKETAQKDIEAGIEFGQLPFYVKHLYEGNVPEATLQKVLNAYQQKGAMLNKKASFQKERTIDTIAEAERMAKFAKDEMGINLKPIKDIRVLTTVRELEGIAQRATRKLYDDIVKMGDTVIADADKAPRGWVVMPVEQFKGKAIHPEVARHLERFTQVTRSVDGMEGVANLFNHVQSLWKGWVTTSVPFHIRNALGNVYNNFLEGVVNPHMYSIATDIQAGMNRQYVLNGQRYTGQQIRQLFRQQGLEGFGIFEGESLRNLTREVQEDFGKKNLSVNPLNKDFALVRGSRAVGDKLETNAKLAHFVDKMAKGWTPEQAAQSVRKYLFDYGDLTPTEIKLRNIFPFYTWTKKNIPLQLESLITQPGKPAAVNKLVENMRNVQGVQESDMPDWLAEEMAIPIMVDENDNQIYLKPDLPIANLNMFGGLSDTLRNATGMISPLFKVPLELGMERQIFTGQPIEKYPGAQVNWAGHQVPAKVGYALNQFGSMPRTAASFVGQPQDPAGSSNIPPAPRRTPGQELFFGSLMTPVDPDRQRILNKLDREQQLGDFRKQLVDVQGIQVPTVTEIRKGRGKGLLGVSLFDV